MRRRQHREDQGLTDAGQLQGWFTEQVAAVLTEDGRRLVGWDEMVETDCPKDAVIGGLCTTEIHGNGVRKANPEAKRPADWRS